MLGDQPFHGAVSSTTGALWVSGTAERAIPTRGCAERPYRCTLYLRLCIIYWNWALHSLSPLGSPGVRRLLTWLPPAANLQSRLSALLSTVPLTKWLEALASELFIKAWGVIGTCTLAAEGGIPLWFWTFAHGCKFSFLREYSTLDFADRRYTCCSFCLHSLWSD